jgi:hypothetical protein
MANFKRNKPRTRSYGSRGSSRTCWLNTWPAWHDILYHSRPRRRADTELAGRVRRGEIDPDDTVWAANHKPHKYYW